MTWTVFLSRTLSLSGYLSLSVFLSVSVSLSLSLSIYIYICLSLCLSVCLSFFYVLIYHIIIFLFLFLPASNVSLNLDMNMFFNQECKFYTYYGSTTVPFCRENVQWFIFREPLRVSERAVSTFRTLAFITHSSQRGERRKQFNRPNIISV